MIFDIDQVLDATNPWDFTVQVGGVLYSTRRPVVAELAVFQAAVANPERLAPMVAGLFPGDAPAVAAWTVDQLLAFCAGYLAYFQRVAERGKPTADVMAAAEAAVASAMGAEVPSGGSPPPS